MLAVCVSAPGGPDKLSVDRVPIPQPKAGEILIKVHATALNRADLLQRRGLYPAPPGESEILGLEAAGIVAVMGSKLKGQWALGQRVMALLSGGGYAEFVAVPEDLVMPAPPNLSLIQAAALPEAWLTAFQLIHLIGEVNVGETVLVHAGASGVGTAAVQLLCLTEAIPLVTAGNAQKLEMAKSLGAAAVFNYKDEDFSSGVMEFTKGRGVDVILDCVGGSFWEKNVECLAVDGRWVLYGTMGGRHVDGDMLGKLLAKRGRLLCSLLRSRSLQYKAELVRAFSERALPHFETSNSTGALKPVIDSVFSLHDIAKAHQHMEVNGNSGKIIVSVAESTLQEP